MGITIKYFGQIVEITQKKEETLFFTQGTISDCLTKLYQIYPDLKNTSFKIAQAQKLVSEETILTGEELALLPPFAGG